MSVDLWIEGSARAKVIVVRLLGGLDWWKYGIERLFTLAQERKIALAVLPGEDRDDARLASVSTLPPQELERCWLFREGGRENLRGLPAPARRPRRIGSGVSAGKPVPRFAGYPPDDGARSTSTG